MNKRGSEVLEIVVVSIIIILLVLFLFILPIKQITEDKSFTQKKAAVDLAYIIDIIQSTPDNLDLIYKKQDLYATFTPSCEISVSNAKEEQIKINKKDCFLLDKFSMPQKESLSLNSLKIKKEGDIITIEE